MKKYGIGEWYGRNFLELTVEERVEFARISREGLHKTVACPFRSRLGTTKACSKRGGVCSIRNYESVDGLAALIEGPDGTLRATCPNRFQERNTIYDWVAEEVLNSTSYKTIGEVGFLKSEKGNREVGRIDSVLLLPGTTPLQWCALEIQAVYFSGKKMGLEFDAISVASGAGVFPKISHRPDYRSSSAKRLMPQLETKVPTLRRWGKKMAIVVDAGFFESLGTMDNVSISNSDLAWFVVSFDDTGGDAVLKPDYVRFTTLEKAVEGLTAGFALTLPEFEERIVAKASKTKSADLPDLKQ